MPWNDGLEGKALAIASYDGSPLHVLAGPGTGKTYSLMRRVARFIETGSDPSKILAVTFTRVAANDLLVNLHQLGVDGCEQVKATTLHAYCFEVLNRNAVLLATGRVPRPLLKHEISVLLEDISDRFGSKKDRQQMLSAFSAAWARLQTDQPGWPTSQTERDFQNELISWLRFHRAVLIGELVPLTLSYIRNNPACPERNQFEIVLADEYQDLNKSEQALIDLISANSKLTVVGDDDQSIYQFMKFAHPEGIIDFPRLHPHAAEESLEECRRCPTLVVEMADSLIHHNRIRSPRNLRPRPVNPRGDVSIVQWGDIDAEAAGVSSYVCDLIDRRGIAEKDILVLCPRRLLGYKIRDSIRDATKRVRSCFTEDALDGTRAKRQFVLLNLLAHSDDLPAFRFWLGIDSQSRRSSAYGRLRAFCDRNTVSPIDALRDISEGNNRIPYTDGLVKRYSELQTELNALRTKTPTEIVDALFPQTDEETQELRALSELALNTGATIERLFEYIRSQIAHPELPQVEDSVRIMSLHKSKGLTARAVIVAGCIEGWLPQIDEELSTAQQHRQLEEARRLFYVALTRTTEILVVSSALFIDYRTAQRTGAQFRRAGRRARTMTSRFVGELGQTAPPPILGQELLASLNQ